MRPSISFLSFISVILLSVGNSVVAAAEPLETREGPSSGLRGLIVGPQSFDVRKGVLKPFVSDGCSMSPDGPGRKNPAWVDCCIEHDISYWAGGTLEQKKQADNRLGQCIAEKGYPKIAKIYQWGVGIGGSAKMNTYYRWGYGWNYIRPYSPLTQDEIVQAETLYGPGLQLLHQAFGLHAIPVENIYDNNEKFGVEDISVRRLSNGEVQIYDYLKANLLNNDVVKRAIIYHESSDALFLEIQLRQCPGRFWFEVYINGDHPVKVLHEGSCLKQGETP